MKASWLLGLPLVAALRHVPLSGIPIQISLDFLGSDRTAAPAALIALSEQGILSRSQPTTGELLWRQRIQGAKAYQVAGDLLLAHTSDGVQLFNAVTGFLQWERPVPRVLAAYIKGNETVVVSPDGVRLLSLETGEQLQQWPAQKPVMLFDDESMAAYHGDALVIGSNRFNGASSILPFPLLNKLVFLSESNTVTLACPKITTLKSSNGEPFTSLIPLDGLASEGYFIARKQSGQASVLRFKRAEECQVESAWEFQDSVPDAIHTGSLDRSGRVYVTRLTFNPYMGLGSLSTYSATLHRVQGSTFPFSPQKHGRFVLGTSEVALSTEDNSPSGPTIISRSVWLTSTGSLQLWFGGGQDKPEWVREEGLARAQQLAWVDDSTPRLPSVIPRGREGMLAQYARHIVLAKLKLESIDWANLAKISTWFQPRLKDADGRDWLTTEFQFHKTAVLASERGTVYAVDAMKSKGDLIVWTARPIELDSFAHRVNWKSLDSFKVEGRQVLVGVAQVHKATVETVVVTLEASTGRLLGAKKLFDGPADQIFNVPVSTDEDASAIAILGPSNKIHVHSLLAGAEVVLPKKPLYYYLQDSPKSIKIFKYDWEKKTSEDTWRWSLPLSVAETIQSITLLSQGPLASIGKVRADRSTLYKYLDPHLFLVTTYDPKTKSASLQLINAVAGHYVWSTHIEDVNGSHPITAALAENWLVFAYVAEGSPGKASRVISVELYEEPVKKRVTPRNFTAFEATPPPQSFSRTFIAPFGIKSMAFSQTRLGVTTKALLITTSTDALMTIPRVMLDPRRPFTAKPSKEDMEEMLQPYDPLIPPEPKLTLSQNYRVYQGAFSGLSSTATLLESTSLVLNYGLDLFAVKVAPSKTFDVLSEDFNKLQLLATIFGLGTACAILRPIVNNRKLRSKWYTS